MIYENPMIKGLYIIFLYGILIASERYVSDAQFRAIIDFSAILKDAVSQRISICSCMSGP